MAVDHFTDDDIKRESRSLRAGDNRNSRCFARISLLKKL